MEDVAQEALARLKRALDGAAEEDAQSSSASTCTAPERGVTRKDRCMQVAIGRLESALKRD